MPWENVSGLGIDNTNANIGNCNSLKTRVLMKNAEVVIARCPCHILHNTAGKASEAFAVVSKFNLENSCIDVFHSFEKFTKRKSILKVYYDFCELNKYISTLDLSTERFVDRELKKYPGLWSYLQSQNERGQ